MREYKRNGGKGYYIALVLCAAAIGITGYVMNRTTEKETLQEVTPVPEATVSGELGQADIPVIATQPRNDSPAQPDTLQEPAPTEGKRSLKTVSPVSGKTVSGYSVEALSYN